MAVAAIILALMAGVGVYVYASNADSRAERDAQFVDALVANSDIAKGTTGAEAIQAGLVHSAKVARGSVPTAIVTDINSLNDKVAAAQIDNKQFITGQTFITPEQGGGGGTFAAAIATKDLVALSISVDQERGVANQIAAGDHVDIAITKNDANNIPTTTYLMTNVKVLAVGAATIEQQKSAGGTAPPVQLSGLLTFEVTPDAALQLISAKNGGNLYLVLLPPGAAGSTTTGSTKAPAASR